MKTLPPTQERVNGASHSMKAKTLEGRLRHFETLLEQINASVDSSTQAKIEEVIRVLMELHGAGLERLLDLIWESGPEGKALIDGPIVQDDLASSLLLLHGLHPLSLETRVSQALEKVRPYMRSHGGDVDILGITEDGVIHLRLDGTCHGCPSSRVTLKFAVEKAIYEAAPDAAGIEVIGENDAEIERRGDAVRQAEAGKIVNGKGWVEVRGLETLEPGAVRIQNVAEASILFCRIENSFYAYGSRCPKCGQSLGQAKMAGVELTCAQCGHRYDVMRAGRDLDEPALHLAPLPLITDSGRIQVALASR